MPSSPTTVSWRRLAGVSQLTSSMPGRARREAQQPEQQVLVVGVDPLGQSRRRRGSAARRRSSDRMSTSWVREVDGHADVADPGRERARRGGWRSRRRVRQPAGPEQPAELEHGRVEPLDVADLDRRRRGARAAATICSRLVDRRGQRLLDQDRRCRARSRRGRAARWVVGRRGDDDARRGPPRRSSPAARRTRCAPDAPRSAAARTSATGSATATSRTPGRVAQDAQVVAAHRAEPGQADPELAVADRAPGVGHRAAPSAAPRPALAPTWRSTAARTASITVACSSSVRPGIHRQGQRPGGGGVGHRQVGVEPALHDVRLAMDRDRVVDVRRRRPRRGRSATIASRAGADVERVLVEDVGPARPA